MTENSHVSCAQVVEELASVLDGSAPAELLDHVAGCDACRDARYDAERAELLMTEAGSDFQVPDGLAKLLAVAVITAPAPAPAPVSPPQAPLESKAAPPAPAMAKAPAP